MADITEDDFRQLMNHIGALELEQAKTLILEKGFPIDIPDHDETYESQCTCMRGIIAGFNTYAMRLSEEHEAGE